MKSDTAGTRFTRRRILEWGVMVSALTAVAACQTQPAEKPAGTTTVVEKQVVVTATPNQKYAGKITYLTTERGYGDTDVKKGWLADFRLLHPESTIDQMYAAATANQERLNTMVAAGTPPDMYDVRQGTNAMLTNLPLVRDLTDLVARDAKEVQPEDLFKEVLEPCYYKGKLLMWPDHPTVTSLTYNTALFEEGKIAVPTNDWKYDQLPELLKPLTKKDSSGKPTQWARTLAWSDALWMGTMWEFGSDFVSEDWTKIGFATPEGVAAMQWLYDQMYKYELAPGPGQDIQGGFPGGSYATTWDFQAYLWPNARQTKMPFDIVLPPPGPAGYGIRRVVNATALTKDAKNPDLAWEYLKFISATEQQLKMTAIGFPPKRKSVAETTWLVGTPESRTADPKHMENFFLTLEKSRNQVLLPNLAEYTDKVIKPPLDLLREKKLTPAEACKQAADSTVAWLKTQKRPE